MGFNYTSITPTQAHKHSTVAGDGGNLDSTTSINGSSLFALLMGAM